MREKKGVNMFKRLEIKKDIDHYYIDSDTHFITDNFDKYGEAINDTPITVVSHKSNRIFNKDAFEFDVDALCDGKKVFIAFALMPCLFSLVQTSFV